MNINELKLYLKNGRYIVFNDASIIPLNSGNLQASIKKLIKHKLFAKIRLTKVSDDSSDTSMKGDSILFRKWDGQILIFDHNSKWVFRKYTNPEQVTSLKNGYDTLTRFYQVPILHFIDENTTKEEIFEGITLRKVNIDRQNEIFQDILTRYEKVISGNDFAQTISQISHEEFFIRLNETNYPDEMKGYLSSEKENITTLLKNLKWTWSHCDLSPDNVLVNEHSYSLIDSEWCGSMPLLYDIINLILTLKTMAHNSRPMDDYFKGTHDSLLAKVIGQERIGTESRLQLYLIMLVLKATVAWDAKRKHNNKQILYGRWETVRNRIR